MKYYSIETTRQHNIDLVAELKLNKINELFRYFVVNNNNGKITLPMYDLAYKIPRQWPSTGLLDVHDIAQEFYVALSVAWSRVDWAIINTSKEPNVRLWKYLKKSIILDVRHEINSKKDGMKISRKSLWATKGQKKDDFFTSPMEQYWFWMNDELLNIVDDSGISTWEAEELNEALNVVMRSSITDTERLVLEMSYGVDQPYEEKRSIKYIAKYFSLSERQIKRIKVKALVKLSTKENKEYLREFIES